MPRTILELAGVMLLGLAVYLVIGRRMDPGIATGLALIGAGCIVFGFAFSLPTLTLFWVGAALIIGGAVWIAVRENKRTESPR